MSFAIAAWLCVFAAYVIPSSIALHREHPRARWIVAVNLVLGWTWIGWVFALVWAMAGASRKALAGAVAASLVVTGLMLWHEWPTGAGQAAPSPDQQTCLGGPGISGNVQADACTRIITETAEPAHNRAAALVNRGIVYQGGGFGDRALADFSAAIALDSALGIAYRNRAALEEVHHDHAQALADYGQALALKPDDASALMGRGVVYRAQGDLPKAIEQYGAAIQAQPQQPAAYYARGELRETQQDLTGALADYDQAAKVAPTMTLGWQGRCRVELEQGQLDAALGDCDHALTLQPGLFVVRDLRGWIKLKQGDASSALAEFAAALTSRPNFAASLYGRGLARQRSGDADGAADLAAALTLDPEIKARVARYGA